MTEELIKFTPGERPAHIGPDELVEHRCSRRGDWVYPKPASEKRWSSGVEYRLATPPLTDDQLEAQCNARGWIVTKPLVTQAERDRLADALDAYGSYNTPQDIRDCQADEAVRAFIDTYEGAGQ